MPGQAVEPNCEFQDLELSGLRYRLIVQSVAGAWECYGFVQAQREFSNPFHETVSSEAEAKQRAHRWAYAAAGDASHSCDGNCAPWQTTFNNAVAIWLAVARKGASRPSGV